MKAIVAMFPPKPQGEMQPARPYSPDLAGPYDPTAPFDPPPDPRDPPVLTAKQAAIGVTQDSLTRAVRDTYPQRLEYLRLRKARQTENETERLEATEQLRALCQQWGYQRVGRWLRNLAAMEGVDLGSGGERR